MKRNVFILTLLLVLAGNVAAQRTEFVAGREYYRNGEFRKAVSQLRLALKASPNDAEACYWLGRSYEVLADIATPFGHRNNRRALFYLTRAVELAPERPDYRRELFDLRVDSAGSWRVARRQTEGLLRMVPQSDPSYRYMKDRLESARAANFSAEAELGNLLLAAPRAALRIAEPPAPGLSSRQAEPVLSRR